MGESSGRVFVRVEADGLRAPLSNSDRRLSAGNGPRRRSESGPIRLTGCRGVFCKICEPRHSTQVCGVSASRVVEFVNQARLADPGLAGEQQKLAFAALALPSAAAAPPFPPRDRPAACASAVRSLPAGAARPDDAIEGAAGLHALEPCEPWSSAKNRPAI